MSSSPKANGVEKYNKIKRLAQRNGIEEMGFGWERKPIFSLIAEVFFPIQGEWWWWELIVRVDVLCNLVEGDHFVTLVIKGFKLTVIFAIPHSFCKVHWVPRVA